jgi:hypothetical protein
MTLHSGTPGAAGNASPQQEPPFGADDELFADELDRLIGSVLGRRQRPVAWALLDAEQAAQAWTDLDAWVRWLVRRYLIDTREVPPCWPHHGQLVEELSALRTAHEAAFDPSGPPNAPSEWHHSLDATRHRMRDLVARTGCRPAEHRQPPTPAWAGEPPPAEYLDDLHTAVEADLRGR